MKTWLPEDFCREMKALLGEEYQQYIESFDGPKSLGLRVNTLRWTPGECRRRLPWSTEPVGWVENGLFYEETANPSRDPYYYAGLYYLQEPSAMTPASLLPVEPGDMVLDLCAAPGGKSTELGARLKGRGMLVANDISSSRARALVKNLELFGVGNVCVTSETPERLAAVFPRFFHKILVDAPCSGEGMFRKNPEMAGDWERRGPEYYCPLQKAIVKEAVSMLRPGGYLLYSTCTFSRLEDEEVVKWALESFEDMELRPLPLFDGASGGAGLSGCLRLFPHKIRGEGHFIALLRKKTGEGGENGGNPEGRANLNTRNVRSRDLGTRSLGKNLRTRSGGEGMVPVNLEEERELKAFLGDTRLSWDTSRLVRIQDMICYLPEGFSGDPGLRYLRTGLLVGTVKKGRFEPSQAMAMALGRELYANSISFDRDDPRVVRYLKGETIALEDREGPRTGWCLVCVEEFALGFAKGNHMTLKNKYYPGWRWQ